jgi:hydrogenase/urease accessory protein HupE
LFLSSFSLCFSHVKHISVVWIGLEDPMVHHHSLSQCIAVTVLLDVLRLAHG